MKSAKEILKEYVDFEDVNGNKTVELLPLTIVDAIEEYAEQVEIFEATWVIHAMSGEFERVGFYRTEEEAKKGIEFFKVERTKEVAEYGGKIDEGETGFIQKITIK